MSGDPVVDFEPLQVHGNKLNTLFEDKKRNFITHVDPKTFSDKGVTSESHGLDNRVMVRVNCKFDPYDSKVEFLQEWRDGRNLLLVG